MAKKKNAEWIKLDTEILDNNKLLTLHIKYHEEGLLMELLWVKLLCLAGKCNNDGKLSVTDDAPFTDEIIASKTLIPLEIVKKAMPEFVELKMITIDDNFYSICDWKNHQNVKYMRDKKAAYDRRYQQEKRDLAKEKETHEENRTISSMSCSVSVSNNNTNINNNLDVDFEKAWTNTFKTYPKKDGAVMAKSIWMQMLVAVTPSNRKDVAILILKATKAYIRDFEQSDSYKEHEYKYLKKYERFLKEDCEYWMSEVEKLKETGS